MDLEGTQPIQVDYDTFGIEFCEANINSMLSFGSGINHEYQLTLSVTNTRHSIDGSSPYKTIRHVCTNNNKFYIIWSIMLLLLQLITICQFLVN